MRIYLMLFVVTSALAPSCVSRNGRSSEKELRNKFILTEPDYVVVKNGEIPNTDQPIVIRTDFSNEMDWKIICNEILTPEREFGFLPNVVFSNDSVFLNLSEERIATDIASKYGHTFIFLVDKVTISNPEHPILCVGLKHNRGLKFRTIPSEMWAVENNLSISNMDFQDFMESKNIDGIYRGLD